LRKCRASAFHADNTGSNHVFTLADPDLASKPSSFGISDIGLLIVARPTKKMVRTLRLGYPQDDKGIEATSSGLRIW